MKIRKQFLLLFISTSHLFVYAQNTEPSMFTKEANEQMVKSLPFDNKQDFEDATRGFIATIDEPSIIDETGKECFKSKNMLRSFVTLPVGRYTISFDFQNKRNKIGRASCRERV